MKPIEVLFPHHYGLREIAGKEDNPVIIQWFNDLGYDGKKLKDETSWCSLTVCWACEVAGYQHTGKLYADSWLTEIDLDEIEIDKAEYGDIVVLWRGSFDGELIPGSSIPKRHVCLWVNKRDNAYFNGYGGNQGNELKIAPQYISRIKKILRPRLKPSL